MPTVSIVPNGGAAGNISSAPSTAAATLPSLDHDLIAGGLQQYSI